MTAIASGPICGQISSFNRVWFHLQARHRSERQLSYARSAKMQNQRRPLLCKTEVCKRKPWKKLIRLVCHKNPAQGVVWQYNTVLCEADSDKTTNCHARLRQQVRGSFFERYRSFKRCATWFSPFRAYRGCSFPEKHIVRLGLQLEKAYKMLRFVHFRFIPVSFCVLAGLYETSSFLYVCFLLNVRPWKPTSHRLVSRWIGLYAGYLFGDVKQLRGEETCLLRMQWLYHIILQPEESGPHVPRFCGLAWWCRCIRSSKKRLLETQGCIHVSYDDSFQAVPHHSIDFLTWGCPPFGTKPYSLGLYFQCHCWHSGRMQHRRRHWAVHFKNAPSSRLFEKQRCPSVSCRKKKAVWSLFCGLQQCSFWMAHNMKSSGCYSPGVDFFIQESSVLHRVVIMTLKQSPLTDAPNSL